MKKVSLLGFLALLLAGCQPTTAAVTSTPVPILPTMVLATPATPVVTHTALLSPTPGIPPLQTLTLENAERLQLIQTLEIPGYQQAQVSQCSVAFNPDGRLLVAACGNSRVPVWEVQGGQLLFELYEQPKQIVSCSFNPQGDRIACGGFDKTITIWDAETGQNLNVADIHEDPIWDVDFSPDGSRLVSCSLGLFGRGRGKGEVRLWETLDGQQLWAYAESKDFLSVSYNPSGENLAYGSLGGNVGILDAANGELITELSDSTHNIGDLTFSPSGRWLAAGSDDYGIYLWDTSDYELEAQFEGHSDYVNGVAFSPDEELLISGSHDRSIGVWNLEGQELITSLQGHENAVLRVAFNPQGTLIASVSWDGTVRLWGVAMESPLAGPAAEDGFVLEKSSQEFTSPETFQASLGDLDGDGDLDVVVGRFNGGAEIWLNLTNP